MKSPASVNIARLTYLVICELSGVALALSTKGTDFEITIVQGLIGGLIVAALFILIERLIKGFTLRGFSTATFGLLVGIFCAWLLTRVGFDELIANGFGESSADKEEFVKLAFQVCIFASLGFIGSVLAIRSNRDDFAFIVPYVRFRRDDRSDQVILLDTDSVTDGRIPELINSGFIGNNIAIPRFVLAELREMVESQDPNKKRHSERGLKSLDLIRDIKGVHLSIPDTEQRPEEETHEEQILRTVKLLNARLLTTDEQTARSARLQRIKVLSLNELESALQPELIIGSKLRLSLVRPGKDEHQAVGYLSDGTMIVVNNAITKIGTTQSVTVVSSLNTQAGKMIFADLAA